MFIKNGRLLAVPTNFGYIFDHIRFDIKETVMKKRIGMLICLLLCGCLLLAGCGGDKVADKPQERCV